MQKTFSNEKSKKKSDRNLMVGECADAGRKGGSVGDM